MSNILLDEFDRELVTQLSDDEVFERADAAAQKLAERDQTEAERAAAQKIAKGKVERLDAEIREHLREVRLRQASQMVAFEQWIYPVERAVVTIRTDTGEVVTERPAREEELQLHLLPKRGDPDTAASEG